MAVIFKTPRFKVCSRLLQGSHGYDVCGKHGLNKFRTTLQSGGAGGTAVSAKGGAKDSYFFTLICHLLPINTTDKFFTSLSRNLESQVNLKNKELELDKAEFQIDQI